MDEAKRLDAEAGHGKSAGGGADDGSGAGAGAGAGGGMPPGMPPGMGGMGAPKPTGGPLEEELRSRVNQAIEGAAQ